MGLIISFPPPFRNVLSIDIMLGWLYVFLFYYLIGYRFAFSLYTFLFYEYDFSESCV